MNNKATKIYLPKLINSVYEFVVVINKLVI